MILLKLTDPDSNISRICDGGSGVVVGGHFWKPYLDKGMRPIQMRLDTVYGGMYRNSGTGTAAMSPDAIAHPAPLKLQVQAFYSLNGGTIQPLFDATGYLSSVKSNVVTYKLYNPEYDIDALDEDTSTIGSGEDRVMPRIFGTMVMQDAMRIGTVDDYTYWKADIQGTDPSEDGGTYSVHDGGLQKDKYVEGVGTIVDEVTGFKSVLKSDGTTANQPYGKVMISGTGSITTLSGLFTWAVARINADSNFTGYTLNTSSARTVSPNINFYLVEQINLLDLLSAVSAFFTHCFYIDEVTKVVYLIDMLKDNGSLHISSDDGELTNFFTSGYQYPSPIKELKAEWMSSEAGVDQDGYPLYLEKKHNMVITAPNMFGTDDTFECYTTVVADIETAIINIGVLKQAPTATVDLPFGDVILPGQRVYWTDTKCKKVSDVQIRARTIEHNPINGSVKVEGNVF